MRLLSLSEASIQKRTSTAKFARSPCTDAPGSLLRGRNSMRTNSSSTGCGVRKSLSKYIRSEREVVQAVKFEEQMSWVESCVAQGAFPVRTPQWLAQLFFQFRKFFYSALLGFDAD